MPQSQSREIRHCSGLPERDSWPSVPASNGREGFLQGDHPSGPGSHIPASEMAKPGRALVVPDASRPLPHPHPPQGSPGPSLPQGAWGRRRLPADPTQPGRASPSAAGPADPASRPPSPPPRAAGGSSSVHPPLPGPSRRRRAGRRGGGEGGGSEQAAAQGPRRPGANISLCGGSAGRGGARGAAGDGGHARGLAATLAHWHGRRCAREPGLL